MSDYGIIYVVKNSHYGKDIFKVGKSSRTLDERIKELCLNTIAAHKQLRESANYNDVLLKKVVNLK